MIMHIISPYILCAKNLSNSLKNSILVKKGYMMIEEWRNIGGYEGLYQVSNMGRVKSIHYYHGTYERIMKPGKINSGYLVVSLCKDGKTKGHLVHRLVAQAFLDNTDNLTEVNHKDENPLNNSVGNLEFCDRKYNVNYGTGNQRRAKTLSRTVYQYTMDGELVKEWKSLMEIERSMGFSVGNISQCCNGQRKTAYGYKWTYNKLIDSSTKFI